MPQVHFFPPKECTSPPLPQQFNYLFIYFWLHLIFVAVHGLSLVAASRGYSSLRFTDFSLCWLFLLWSTGSRLKGSAVVAHGLTCLRHVESYWTRDQTCNHCIGRWTQPLDSQGSPAPGTSCFACLSPFFLIPEQIVS